MIESTSGGGDEAFFEGEGAQVCAGHEEEGVRIGCRVRGGSGTIESVIESGFGVPASDGDEFWFLHNSAGGERIEENWASGCKGVNGGGIAVRQSFFDGASVNVDLGGMTMANGRGVNCNWAGVFMLLRNGGGVWITDVVPNGAAFAAGMDGDFHAIEGRT